MLGQFQEFKRIKNIDEIKKYSINLMWINRTLNKSNPYICNFETEEELVTQFLDKAKKWKEANVDATVNIDYDGRFVTKEQLEATKAVLAKKAIENPHYKVQLRDIREFDIVSKNPDAFSDNIPLYTRIDLLKLIICVNGIEIDEDDAIIFADQQVCDLREKQDRMSKQELFNPDVMKKLEKIGFQQIADGHKDENQFYQVINKPETLLALKIYINACLEQINFALNIKWTKKLEDQALTDLCTFVFDQQRQLHALIVAFNFEKDIKIKSNYIEGGENEDWIKYDPQKHGNLSLGNYYCRDPNKSFVVKGFDIAAAKKSGNPPQVLSKFVQLPLPLLDEDEYQYIFSRNDLQTRPGGSHTEQIDNLIKRQPADGSDTYKFEPYPIKGVDKKQKATLA